MSRDVYARNSARLGARLRARRREVGVRIVDLAEVAGVDISTVSRFETGKGAVGPEIMQRLVLGLRFIIEMSMYAERYAMIGNERMARWLTSWRPVFVGTPVPMNVHDQRPVNSLKLRADVVRMYRIVRRDVRVRSDRTRWRTWTPAKHEG